MDIFVFSTFFLSIKFSKRCFGNYYYYYLQNLFYFLISSLIILFHLFFYIRFDPYYFNCYFFCFFSLQWLRILLCDFFGYVFYKIIWSYTPSYEFKKLAQFGFCLFLGFFSFSNWFLKKIYFSTLDDSASALWILLFFFL
jgi:hypothetical protein